MLNLMKLLRILYFIYVHFRFFLFCCIIHQTLNWIESKNSYRIQQGSFDDFVIDNRTGSITIARKLDYDKRENYRIEVVASDLGNK